MPNKRQQASKTRKVPLKPSLSRTMTLAIIVIFHILLLSALAFGIVNSTTTKGNSDATSTMDIGFHDKMHAHSIRLDNLAIQIDTGGDCYEGRKWVLGSWWRRSK
ncbi:hypothetical protein ONS96_005328 [Cadophora gregata f. sp. sojae]|nr:hypothetical protein ONS96_005328 [Cadophora gregata f. sp. sojae]